MLALPLLPSDSIHPGMTEPLLGRSLNRLEDERFVQGRGRYIADLAAPNALHGVVVRSTHAHARIAAIRVDAARQMQGVAAVLTGAELASDNIGPLPCAVTSIPMTTPLVVPPCHALAREIVRYVGEPMAFVVADSAESARNAAEAVVVEYEPLPPVVSIADAVLPGAPSIWPEAKDNIAFQFNRGEIGPVEAAIRGAAHVVECELVNNRVVAAPLETRGALGEFDAASGRLHLIASAAGAHGIRDLLADSVFRVAREKLRVSIPDVGGGFGMKNVLYPELVLVLWAARRLGRPVMWIGDRGEDFTGSAHGRDSVVRARLALDRDGRFLALDTEVLANLGRLCLDGGAGRADHGDGERDGRRLRHPADRISDPGRVHQHDAGRRLSRRRQARGELSDRALHRHRRPPTRDGCAKTAAQEHLSSFSPCERDGAFGRAGQLCARDRSRGGGSGGIRCAAEKFTQAGQAARPRLCLLSRNRARPAQ